MNEISITVNGVTKTGALPDDGLISMVVNGVRVTSWGRNTPKGRIRQWFRWVRSSSIPAANAPGFVGFGIDAVGTIKSPTIGIRPDTVAVRSIRPA